VLSLYAHPWLSHPLHLNFKENVRNTLEAEYQSILLFTKEHSDRYVIARNPADARIALNSKKQVLILSIEGAFGALDEEEDFKKWIDERGVAILTPFHLTEDYYGGVAFMKPLWTLFTSPLNFIESILISGGECLKTYCRSPMGLKPQGRDLIERLISKKVWIDFAHANDLERQELLPLLKKNNLPLLITHSALSEFYRAERGISALEMEYLKNSGGIVGLIPSDDFLEGAGSQTSCFSGLLEYKREFRLFEQQVGKFQVMVGSDINAPLRGLSPKCKTLDGELLGEFESRGFYRYDQFSSLTDYLASDPTWNAQTEEAFLTAWEKVRPH